MVQETDGNGVTQASYVLGDDELLAQTRSGAVSYYLSDGQNNVRLLTDANGAITDRYTYDAYGNLLSSQGTTVNLYRYTGQQLDSLTGLYDLRARYYDPTVGRFLSRDTAGIDVNNPVEVNRYSYVQDNPINLSDPSGHDAVQEDEETTSEVAVAFNPSKAPPIWVGIIVGVLLFVLTVLSFAPFHTILVGPNPQPQQGTPPVGYPTPTPDKDLFIYREARGPGPKAVALRREVDWVTGLSFDRYRHAASDLRYRVTTLLQHHYAVRFDTLGSLITDVHTGMPPNPQTYPDLAKSHPDLFTGTAAFHGNTHVTVYLAEPNGLAGTEWDKWWFEEKGKIGQNPYVPSQQTIDLYNLQEPGP